MKTLDFDEDELKLLLAAVRSYLDDFGHEEADLLRRVKHLLMKLQAQATEPAHRRALVLLGLRADHDEQDRRRLRDADPRQLRGSGSDHVEVTGRERALEARVWAA